MAKVVEVYWEDACVRATECLDEFAIDYVPGVFNQTVGYLVGEKNGFIVLAMEYDNGASETPYRTIFDIPVVNVQQIIELIPGGKVKKVKKL